MTRQVQAFRRKGQLPGPSTHGPPAQGSEFRDPEGRPAWRGPGTPALCSRNRPTHRSVCPDTSVALVTLLLERSRCVRSARDGGRPRRSAPGGRGLRKPCRCEGLAALRVSPGPVAGSSEPASCGGRKESLATCSDAVAGDSEVRINVVGSTIDFDDNFARPLRHCESSRASETACACMRNKPSRSSEPGCLTPSGRPSV
jgi:hypothetical protein